MGNENYWDKYWDKVTEETTIDWLRRRNLLSVRPTNILTRGAIYRGGGKTEYHPIKTVKELLEVDECELTLYRNMGAKSLEEIEKFKQKFLEKSKVQKLNNANDMISVSAFKAYIEKAKQSAQSLLDRTIALIEKDGGNMNQMVAYKWFTEQVRMYEYEIPNLIKAFLEDNENGRKEIDR